MYFADRLDAARRLAEKLANLKGRNPLVLGIPRGGVIMARVIADALEGELDVALVHKLRHPDNPEVAIGSVDEQGEVYLNELGREPGLAPYVQQEREFQMTELRRKRQMYTPVKAPADPAGRITIVVDDGLATGATMRAALQAVRRRRPSWLVAATAVAPPDTLAEIGVIADEVVCLHVPALFLAVGQFFGDFSQVSDEEVLQALRPARGAGA